MTRQRARIGIIYPLDGMVDDDFWAFSPPGVTLLFTRVGLSKESASAIESSIDISQTQEVDRAAELLAGGKATSIAYACTGGSFVKPGFDTQIAERITKAAGGIPAVTTSYAVVEGLKTLGVRTVSVLTPYSDDLNERLKGYLSRHGVEVVSFKGLDLAEKYHMNPGEVPPESMIRWAKEAYNPRADALFISCTGHRTSDIIETLEHDLRKPVVSSNQATMWKSLALSGVADIVQGKGRLMESPLLAGATPRSH